MTGVTITFDRMPPEELGTPRVVKRIRGRKLPPNTKYVGRPTKWGNPFAVLTGRITRSRQVAVENFDFYIKGHMEYGWLDPTELRGYNLACWCHDWDGEGPNPRYCHADILLEYANA